jgi:hypothetical protein
MGIEELTYRAAVFQHPDNSNSLTPSMPPELAPEPRSPIEAKHRMARVFHRTWAGLASGRPSRHAGDSLHMQQAADRE